jgi:4-amino-4-deoxy-L-arabinose transferase-like glycosyltransferase
MLATVSFVVGILIAALVLNVTRQAPEADEPPKKPTTLAWWTLALGLAEILMLALGMLAPGNIGRWLGPIAYAFAAAAVVVGITTLRRKDRHWPTWVGLIAGLAPALFLLVFAAAYILVGE